MNARHARSVGTVPTTQPNRGFRHWPDDRLGRDAAVDKPRGPRTRGSNAPLNGAHRPIAVVAVGGDGCGDRAVLGEADAWVAVAPAVPLAVHRLGSALCRRLLRRALSCRRVGASD